jgi:GTP cyclohydrolase III
VLLVGVLIGGLLFLTYPTPAASTSKRLKRLENKVETLQKKTQLMSKHGVYRAYIGGDQVLSLCPEGATATWTNEIDNLTELDACIPPEMSTKERRHRLGQR